MKEEVIFKDSFNGVWPFKLDSIKIINLSNMIFFSDGKDIVALNGLASEGKLFSREIQPNDRIKGPYGCFNSVNDVIKYALNMEG